MRQKHQVTSQRPDYISHLVVFATFLSYDDDAGLDHFDEFRYFHFYKAPVRNSEGNVKHVGVLQCKVEVTDKVWHDTHGNVNNVMNLFKGNLTF